METEEQIAQLKKEKAEVERQLEAALRRIVELEEQLKSQEESFQGQMGGMQRQIEEIKRQIGKDSHNSHKPPSSDGLQRKTHSRRKPSGRKRGGRLSTTFGAHGIVEL